MSQMFNLLKLSLINYFSYNSFFHSLNITAALSKVSWLCNISKMSIKTAVQANLDSTNDGCCNFLDISAKILILIFCL